MAEETKTAKIGSVVEYLQAIDKYNLGDCISRGESQKYPTSDSTAFRLGEPRKFQDMVKKYYDTVGNGLTPLQGKHFLAFSQHHGIPTNLIDFSTSPLVSLFFACYESGEKSGDSGYIKIIRNERLLNCNDLFVGYKPEKNFFEDLTSLSATTEAFFEIADKHRERCASIQAHYEELVQQLAEISKRMMNGRYKGINAYEDEEGHRKVLSVLYKFLRNHNYDDKQTGKVVLFNMEHGTGDLILSNQKIPEEVENFFNITKYQPYRNIIGLYFLLLRVIMFDIFSLHLSKQFTKMQLPFYLTYIPPNINNRIANQASVFIYQLFADERSFDNDWRRVYKDGIIWIQPIQFDFTIEVVNKERILRELNKLGINLSTIYNDYDSIAKHIKYTYTEA